LLYHLIRLIRDGSEPIQGAVEIGFEHAYGSKLFDELLSIMSAEATEITPECAMQFQNALSHGFKCSKSVSKKSSTINSKSRKVPAKHDELIACRVELDPSTWVCPVTGTQQHIASLSPAQKKALHDDLFQSVKDYKSLEEANKLNQFSQWLE